MHRLPCNTIEPLFGSFGQWFIHYRQSFPECSPYQAALARCCHVIEVGQLLSSKKCPRDLPVVVGFFVDCHFPLLCNAKKVKTIQSVYTTSLAPEQNGHVPVAVAHPYGSKGCSQDALIAAWFGSACGPITPLVKLLSKGAVNHSSIRYIGPQCERCLKLGGPAAVAVSEMILADQLGAFSHRKWQDIEWNVQKRVQAYQCHKSLDDQLKYIASRSARQLHRMVCEYVVANSALWPATWKAATCMHGGHQYVQAVSAGALLSVSSSGRVRLQRKQSAIKVPTKILQQFGPVAVARVFDGLPAPPNMTLDTVQILQNIAGRHRSVFMIASLPPNVAEAQLTACKRHAKRDVVTIYVCKSCTIAHVKVLHAKLPSKKRFGVTMQLPFGDSEPNSYCCSTCGSKNKLAAISLIGKEVHARVHPSSPPTVLTVCCTCGKVFAGGTHVGLYPTCKSCIKAQTKPRRCLCGNKGHAVGPLLAKTSTNQIVNVWLCSLHAKMACDLPYQTVYPLCALLRIAKQMPSLKRKWVYLT